MFDYEVRFVFELVNVVTYVDADDEWEAIRRAEILVSDSTGFDMVDAQERVATVVGGYGV